MTQTQTQTQHFDDDVPVPAPRMGRISSHSLDYMPVGKSKFYDIFVDGDDRASASAEQLSAETRRMRNRLGNRMVRLRKQGRKFILRFVSENGVPGFRVWRTE